MANHPGGFSPLWYKLLFSKRSQFNSGDLGNTTFESEITGSDFIFMFQSPYGDLGNTTFLLQHLYEDNSALFQSPYGDLGNTTVDACKPTAQDLFSFSPLTGIWVIRLHEVSLQRWHEVLRFSPLTGIWVIRPPSGNIARVSSTNGFSPLTGIWVIRHCLSVPAP